MKASVKRNLARWDAMGQDAPVVSGTKSTLLKYSAALGAAAALATSAEAGIIHTNGPIAATVPGYGTVQNQINVGLGGDVVNLKVVHNEDTFFHQNASARVFGSTAGRVKFASVTFDGDLVPFAANFALNAPIGPALHFVQDPLVQINHWGNNRGDFRGNQTGFAGMELTIASNVYYGWVKLSVASDGYGTVTGMTALEWAYNDVAGQAIAAGDIGSGGGGGSETPEPATAGLAVLAAGSAGVLAWRRRRNAVSAA